MVDGGLIFGFLLIFDRFVLERGVLVDPQLGLRFGAALPGAFFSQKNSTLKKYDCLNDFQMIFDQNGPNLLFT